ncbi:MAG: GNAT family N-acetyltransferase [Polyangiales bacterium]
MIPSPTPRLYFRTWQRADWPLALALWGNPMVTALFGGPFDEAAVRRRFDREVENERSFGVQYWPIFLRENGDHIGCCGLRPDEVHTATFEIGFHLLPAHEGKGLATEGARAVLQHAFDTAGAAGVIAGHHPQNLASKRVLEKLGFRYTQHALYPPTGLHHPGYLLTSESYRKIVPRGGA